MAVPAVILGAAGIMALTGIGAGGSAAYKSTKARNITEQAQDTYEQAKLKAELARDAANKSLVTLGCEKLGTLNTSVQRFVADFNKIHSIELKKSDGLLEAGRFRTEHQAALEVRELEKMAVSVAKGAIGGAGAGALTAAGAFGAVTTFGAASTGTPIAALSGVAAHNATLAFLGGGSLAAGGGGMALGSIVLGGAVAGPAIAVLGIVMNASASKALDQAESNKWEAERVAAGLNVVTSLCNAIHDRAVMFEILLRKLRALLDFHSGQIENILENCGTDYSSYSEEDQDEIAMALSTASALKQLLDTPILNEDGSLTQESRDGAKSLKAYIDEVAAQRKVICETRAKEQTSEPDADIQEKMAVRAALLRSKAKEIWGDKDWLSYKDKVFRSRTLITVTNGAVKNSEVICFFDMSITRDGTTGLFLTETGVYGNCGGNIKIPYEDIEQITFHTPTKVELLESTALYITTKSGKKHRIAWIDRMKLKEYLDYAVSVTAPLRIDAAAEDNLYNLCTFSDFDQARWNGL